MKRHLTYANVMVTLLAFVVLGGGTAVAAKLITGKNVKNSSLTGADVKNRSLTRRDLRSGTLARGPAGATGLKGDTGSRGQIGPRGPGAVTLAGQFDSDGEFHQIATTNGLVVSIRCEPGVTTLRVQSADPGNGFHAWGTRGNANSLQRVPTNEIPGGVHSQGIGSSAVELDIVAQSTSANQAVKYTRIDLSGVPGTKCNYHGLIIPPS